MLLDPRESGTVYSTLQDAVKKTSFSIFSFCSNRFKVQS